MNGQLIYAFLCLAAAEDTPRGKAVPVEGMKLIAALAHKHGIPVTWVTDSRSIESSKGIILQGHLECNDDVAVLIDLDSVLKEQAFERSLRASVPGSDVVPSSKAEEIVILRQKLPELILSEQSKIREMLPWAEANVVAADSKTETLIQILEDLDCIGLWGYRWWDVETDRGCPWSFFYASRDHCNAPASYAGKVVAIESTALDLNAVFHSGNPHVFSANPGALGMSGLCSGEDIAYGKALLGEYIKNCSWNRFLIFIQQQSACGMEYARYGEYHEGTIARTANIMDGFFREVTSSPDIKVLNLPQAIQLYGGKFELTESCCMAFDSVVPPHVDINFYVPPVPNQKPPYPFTFFYYDRECQLIFREGQMTPVEVRNYARPPSESRYYVEKEMPLISGFHPSRDRDKLILEFEIESAKRMPFGLAIWDDHSMFSLVSTNARLVKWIGTHLLFIRIDLEEGLNRVEVSLTI